MSKATEEREVTIEEESKMSLEDIFKRCTKHGIVEDYRSFNTFGFKDNYSSDEDSLNDDDDDDEEDEDDESNSEVNFIDSDDDDDDDDEDEEIGWY